MGVIDKRLCPRNVDGRVKFKSGFKPKRGSLDAATK